MREHWWGDVGMHAQSQEQPEGFPPSQDMLAENTTAETCVVVIVSFSPSFRSKQPLHNFSACQCLPVICGLVAQLSRIGQSRRGPKDIKCSHILWKMKITSWAEVRDIYTILFSRLQRGRGEPTLAHSVWRQPAFPCLNMQLWLIAASTVCSLANGQSRQKSDVAGWVVSFGNMGEDWGFCGAV